MNTTQNSPHNAYWLKDNDGWFDFFRCSVCGHKEPYVPNRVKKTCDCGRRMLNASATGKYISSIAPLPEKDDFDRPIVTDYCS